MPIEPHGDDAQGRPAIGNVLGFSLLLRDRRALLRLDRRTLASGLRLLDFEAEVPDVEFPLRTQGAAAFRGRRCRTERLRLEVEPHALAGWLRAQLEGQVIEGIEIRDVGIDLTDEASPATLHLRVTGRRHGKRQWIMVAVHIRPEGRGLTVAAAYLWRLGEGPLDTAAWWRGLGEKIGGATIGDRPHIHQLDPIRRILLRPFVTAGWRPPDLSQLVVQTIELGEQRATVSWSPEASQASATPPPGTSCHDPLRVVPRLEAIREAIEGGQPLAAAIELERLADDLPAAHPARLEAVRWLASLSRRIDPAREQRALHAWLHLAPQDQEASTRLLLSLGRAGDDQAMARRLAAQVRLPHPPRRRARLQLALATVLVDRVGERAAGRELLLLLLARCLSDESLSDLQGPVRLVLARALADDPARARGQLDAALAVIDRTAAKASAIATVASALDAHQHHAATRPLWAQVVSMAPDDVALVDEALASARANSDPSAAVDLLRTVIPAVTPARAEALRHTLVSALLEVGDEPSHALAIAELRALSRLHPESEALARQLASLQPTADEPSQAASKLATIATQIEDEEDRARLRLEHARLLAEGGKPRQAWLSLEPALTTVPATVEAQMLELAISIAPLSVRDRLLERLVEIDDGPRSGRALLARALSRTSESKRLADLRLAAERLDDPRQALNELASLAGPEETDPWRAWAEACADVDDRQGEATARTELALRLFAASDLDGAAAALTRVRAIAPPDPSIEVATAWIEARRDRLPEAARLLAAVPVDRLALDTPPLSDRRLGLPPSLDQFRAEMGTLLLRGGRPAEAAELLRVAVAQRGVAADPERAAQLIEALEATGDTAEAGTACHALAQLHQGTERAGWLRRGARHAAPNDAVSWLAEAVVLDPGDPTLAKDLERAARQAGDPVRLELALERIATQAELDPKDRARALRSLVSRRRAAGSAQDEPALASLYERLLRDDPNDVDALLALATFESRADNPERARECWEQAVARLAADDARRIEPSLALARHDLDTDQAERAHQRLTAIIDHPAAPRRAHEMLAEASALTANSDTRLRALRGLLSHTPEGPARKETALQLARALSDAGRAHEALPHIQAAITGLPRGTPSHIDAARLWLTLAAAADEPKQEAAARSALRRSLGSEISSKELRAEALLRAERLADVEGARRLIENGLAERPTDELLLSTLKPLALESGSMQPYLVALEAATEVMVAGPDRDRIAAEFATTAAEDGDAVRALRALDRMTATATLGEEMLDLREWGVRSLGLEADELQQLDQRLGAGAVDDGTVARLHRMLGGVEPTVEHLLELVQGADPSIAQRLIAPALTLARPLAIPSLTMQVLRHAVRVGAGPVTEEAWPELMEIVSTGGDDAAIADLMALGDDARAAGFAIDDRLDRLLDASIAHQPSSPHLHRALARHLARPGLSPERLQAELMAHLDAVADRYELPGRDRADLFIGTAEPLDRRTAADLLAARATQYLDDADAFSRLLAALEKRQCWPEVLRLLQARADANLDPEERVATLKHLAHVAFDVLDDSATAVVHLEAALQLAPTDPDLLLPLLDHHFSQTDLSRAITLTERVLEHVRMGDAAFAALAHRAADAAIAQDQAERAAALLQQVELRIPADDKARQRLAELRSRAGQPDQRVRLLADVAERQSGKARIEALEERARLLLDPLERPLEAMEDLAAVVAQDPDRQASAQLLAELYEQHGRFDALAQLIEADLPHHQGLARAHQLQRLATVHTQHRSDPSRAEQALRLAIEALGPADNEAQLADELRLSLADVLTDQGRDADLAAYLETELAAELAQDLRTDQRPPAARLELLRRLALLARDTLDDEARAAQIYERLERFGGLPDEGLATLAHWYRRERRHEDLVRVLQLRALALEEHSERRAAVDLRIAELFDGPLVRPHDAAPYYLDAYLADPESNIAAGTRARVLLSGVDSVVNVRKRLLQRLNDLDPSRRPALLTLLADILAPQVEHEDEAEVRYREAIALDPGLATAHEGLGRLLTRLERHQEAALALVTAASSNALSASRAADTAALAARNFVEIDEYAEAEAVLKQALHRLPDSQRALLELSRVYEKRGRHAELSEVLDQLAELPLSSTMVAEIAYRRALLLRPIYQRVPTGPQGERARSHLLEAVGANPRHAAARRALLLLATDRREWSIVAHMHYLAIRELPPGTQRALVHLDLAGTYLDHLGDPGSAMRNIESALQQAAVDVVVANRTAELARRMPVRRDAAERFETIAAATDNELSDAARARLWLLAADLRMEDDDRDAAAAASKRVLDLPAVPVDATAAANRTLERLHPHDSETLVEASSGVLARLGEQPPPQERAQLLGRLHDIGVALDDDGMVQRATTEQRALAADLDQSDEHALTTSAVLRDLLAERGDYGPLVDLFKRLATQTGDDDPAHSATVLTEAAGYAWRGQNDPSQAAALLGRAIALPIDHPAADDMLRELIEEVADPNDADDIARQLELVPKNQRPPNLQLHLASLAVIRGAEPEALALIRPLTGASVPPETRFEALARLDTLLASRGDQAERRRVLTDFFALAKLREDPRAGDLGLELARLQWTEGDRGQSRQTCEEALAIAADHIGLVHLLAEIAQSEEEWADLIGWQRRLAELSTDDEEHAAWLTQAAQTMLGHPDLPEREGSASTARQLLLRACELDPQGSEPRLALLPLSFKQARWEEVLSLAHSVAAQEDNDHEALVLAALAQAHHEGTRTLAREIGYRHNPDVCRRVLLPGLEQILTEIALRGPLPRLDAVLAAASLLLGGRAAICDVMLSWSAERPPKAGIALGLARLLEARGFAELARNHFQLAAFLAPRGPVPSLVSRLPSVPHRSLDIHFAGESPIGSRSVLRETLTSLRDYLAGLGTAGSPTPEPAARPSPDWWHACAEQAETIVEPWRGLLGLDLPLAWTAAEVRGGIALRNDRPPRIVIGAECTALETPELSFRLAYAAAGVALGLGVLESGTVPIGSLLDALGQLANPAHRPTGTQALALADVLAARDAQDIGLVGRKRATLLDELAHWLTTDAGPARLELVMRRARLWLACRICDRLDGALHAIARDLGTPTADRADIDATLRSGDVQWLLRTLAVRQ